MKIGVIIQARMSSQRLPSKVLTVVNGKPLLQYLLERLKYCSSIDQIVVATSDNKSDDPIEVFCNEYGALCYRGPLLNVAKRFYMVLEKYNFDAFVRICGDSPILDQKLIDHAVKIYNEEYDLVTNILPRSYPLGQSVEVIRTSTFKKVYDKMSTPDHFEHVTKYYYEKAEEFKIKNFSNTKDLSGYRLVVDTIEDLKRIEKIIVSMTKPHMEYSLEDSIKLYPTPKKVIC
jgi:spore coat polysaccharide biosynthesis protein SpsF